MSECVRASERERVSEGPASVFPQLLDSVSVSQACSTQYYAPFTGYRRLRTFVH